MHIWRIQSENGRNKGHASSHELTTFLAQLWKLRTKRRTQILPDLCCSPRKTFHDLHACYRVYANPLFPITGSGPFNMAGILAVTSLNRKLLYKQWSLINKVKQLYPKLSVVPSELHIVQWYDEHDFAEMQKSLHAKKWPAFYLMQENLLQGIASV